MPTEVFNHGHYQTTLQKLQEKNAELQNENTELRKELSTMRESVIVESMNDMKESYRELVRENEELKKTVKNCDEKEMKALKKKCRIYDNMITKMENMMRKSVNTNEMVHKAVINLADDMGEIDTNEFFLDGMFAVMNAANRTISDYIEHDIIHDRECAESICDLCFRCRCPLEDDD